MYGKLLLTLIRVTIIWKTTLVKNFIAPVEGINHTNPHTTKYITVTLASSIFGGTHPHYKQTKLLIKKVTRYLENSVNRCIAISLPWQPGESTPLSFIPR